MQTDNRHRFVADVVVTLKPVVNDPQGLVVADGLRAQGFQEVEAARVGKYIRLELEGDDQEQAGRRVEQMCRSLLCNGVIEDFSFQLRTESE